MKQQYLKRTLLTIVALVILVFLYQGFTHLKYDLTHYEVFVTTDDITLLNVGDPVKIKGVRIGRVENITLNKKTVVYELTIADDILIPKESLFEVKKVGMFGERQIFIIPNSDESGFLAVNDTTSLSLEKTNNLPTVVDRFTQTLDKIDSIYIKLKEIESVLKAKKNGDH